VHCVEKANWFENIVIVAKGGDISALFCFVMGRSEPDVRPWRWGRSLFQLIRPEKPKKSLAPDLHWQTA
jgi:broad specificity phosphatase PhoE